MTPRSPLTGIPKDRLLAARASAAALAASAVRAGCAAASAARASANVSHVQSVQSSRGTVQDLPGCDVATAAVRAAVVSSARSPRDSKPDPRIDLESAAASSAMSCSMTRLSSSALEDSCSGGNCLSTAVSNLDSASKVLPSSDATRDCINGLRQKQPATDDQEQPVRLTSKHCVASHVEGLPAILGISVNSAIENGSTGSISSLHDEVANFAPSPGHTTATQVETEATAEPTGSTNSAQDEIAESAEGGCAVGQVWEVVIENTFICVVPRLHTLQHTASAPGLLCTAEFHPPQSNEPIVLSAVRRGRNRSRRRGNRRCRSGSRRPTPAS